MEFSKKLIALIIAVISVTCGVLISGILDAVAEFPIMGEKIQNNEHNISKIDKSVDILIIQNTRADVNMEYLKNGQLDIKNDLKLIIEKITIHQNCQHNHLC